MLSAVVACVVIAGPPIRVGSKAFTESVILGEVAAQAMSATGQSVTHTRQLGGTAIVWAALERGDIDVYAEYTGTLRHEILSARHLADDTALAAELERRGLVMTQPLGFDDTYALGLVETHARDLGVTKISDLARRPLRYGLSHEFLARTDGWPGLVQRYGLDATRVRGMEHELAYRALARGDVDAIDVYTTDPQIERLGMRVLEDDRGFFPSYRAVFVYRADLAKRAPAAVRALEALGNSIDLSTMRHMNARAQQDGEPESRIAAELLHEYGVSSTLARESWLVRLRGEVLAHLWLVFVSLVAAVILAIPLGVFCARTPRLGGAIVAVCGVVQTVPSLALLVLMIPLFGIGFAPAVAALFLYSLLPIVQNTYLGLTTLPQPLRESARALGLSERARLFQIELPLALPAILAGVKTAAVINVGAATLGALIGAGGLGQPILTGIRLDDIGMVLEGAIPAALLALATQAGFGVLERVMVPRGLRLGRDSRGGAAP